MTSLYITVGIVLFLLVAIAVVRAAFGDAGVQEKTKYQYKHKDFFLTRAEHECYDALVEAVGSDYHVFAQVHLPTIIDHAVVGQDWRAALAHINRKSVDFVLCDKTYISPKLAIELDDRSHERPDRQERDQEVERILREAGVPLLRIQNHEGFDVVQLATQIKSALVEVPPPSL
jgi:hypothetical protein